MKNIPLPHPLRHLAGLLALLLALIPLPASAEKIVLQLNWYHQFQFAGYYAAVEQGYYRKAGLDVAINEVSPGTDPVINVISGKAAFGIASSDLLISRTQGQPVVALAAIFQHSPAAFFSRQRAKPGLNELAGKRMMLDPMSNELHAWLKKEGLPTERFTQLDPSYDPQDLIRGRTDIMSGSLLNEAWFLEHAGFAYTALQPISAGIDFYDGVLFTSEQMTHDQPDTVRAFREASLQGWKYALAHPNEIATLIRSQYSQRPDAAFLAFQAKQMQALVDSEKTPLGSMSADRWQKIGATFASVGKMPKAAPVTDFLYNPAAAPQKPAETSGFNLDIKLWLIAAGVIVAALLAGIYTLLATRLARTRFALHLERQRHLALQEQIRVNEDRYRGLFNSMDNGFALNELINDKDGRAIDYRFVELNPAFEKFSGQPRDKLLGKRASEVLQNTEDNLLEQCAEVVATGQPKYFEKFSQKTCRWFATDAYCPSPGKFAVVTQEITERKQMELALTKAHTELREKYEEITKLQEKLREQAVRDGLTGLYNRRYLDETLIRELSRAQRENYPLCVILIDLDFFKKVNDTYGHLGGDEVLKAFANLMKDHARQGDVACRYGGEEFMLMLPKMPTQVAIDRANLLREKFAATRIPFGDTQIGTTLSIGIAIFPEHGSSPDELTNNADQALYVAKTEGRNRAILYRGDPASNAPAPHAAPTAKPVHDHHEPAPVAPLAPLPAPPGAIDPTESFDSSESTGKFILPDLELD